MPPTAHDAGQDLLALLPSIGALNLFVNRACNLDCSYCFVAKTGESMPLATAFRAIDYFLPIIDRSPGEFHFGFIGGEPTLSLDTMEAVCQRLTARSRASISFGVTTNGTLLVDRCLSMFEAWNMRVVLSMDGGADAMNDRRFRRNARNSYEAVLSGLARLQERGIRHLVQMTITPRNVDAFSDHVRHIVALGVTDVIFGLDYYADWSPGAVAQFRRGLDEVIETYAVWLEKGDPVRLPLIDNEAISFIVSEEATGTPDLACGAAANVMAIATDGSIMPCQNFINHPPVRLGDVWQGLDAALVAGFRARSAGARATCAGCGLMRFCRLCPAANLTRNHDLSATVASSCSLGLATHEAMRRSLPRLRSIPAFRRRLDGLASAPARVGQAGEDRPGMVRTQLAPGIEFEMLGSGGPEGARASRVGIEGRNVLIDPGTEIGAGVDLAVCLLTHGHVRGTAALEALVVSHPEVPILATDVTLQLLAEGGGIPSVVLSRVRTMRIGEELHVGGVSVNAMPSGHLPGAIGARLGLGSRQILWLGAASGPKLGGQVPGLDPQVLERSPVPDAVVLDGTLLSAPTRCLEETAALACFVSEVSRAVRVRHRVVVPASALGRAQYLLEALVSARLAGLLPPDSQLYCDEKVARYTAAFGRAEFGPSPDWKRLPPGSVAPPPGDVLITAPRCLWPGTPSAQALEHVDGDASATVIFTGFAVPGSPLETVQAALLGGVRTVAHPSACNKVLVPFADHLRAEELDEVIRRSSVRSSVWLLHGDGGVIEATTRGGRAVEFGAYRRVLLGQREA